tara:strand:+ start:539 stop:748 length:210 start_codon:yes stop_codon:yes gene_type:complete
MKSSQVLRELQELRKTYSSQFFYFNDSQKQRYDELRSKRRDIVKEWYKNDLVCTTPKVINKPQNVEEKD